MPEEDKEKKKKRDETEERLEEILLREKSKCCGEKMELVGEVVRYRVCTKCGEAPWQYNCKE